MPEPRLLRSASPGRAAEITAATLCTTWNFRPSPADAALPFLVSLSDTKTNLNVPGTQMGIRAPAGQGRESPTYQSR